jgi:hypothetical protein
MPAGAGVARPVLLVRSDHYDKVAARDLTGFYEGVSGR